MRFSKKFTAAFAAFGMLAATLPAGSTVFATDDLTRTVNFDTLGEGAVTDTDLSGSNALGGWTREFSQNNGALEIVTGTLGSKEHSKAMKMTAEKEKIGEILYYAVDANWSSASSDSIADGQYLHISFDIAFSDNYSGRAVYVAGNQKLTALSTTNDGYYVLGNKITKNGPLSANEWHHLEYEIKTNSTQAIGNVWVDGELAVRRQAVPSAQNPGGVVKYVSFANGINNTVIQGGEELYFDNFVYEIKTGNISNPPRTVDYNTLTEGAVTNSDLGEADALGGWTRELMQNTGSAEIVTGSLGDAEHYRAIKLTAEAAQIGELYYYAVDTGWSAASADTISDSRYLHLSFDIAFNDNHSGRAVMIGGTNKLTAFTSTDDGYYILGNKITKNGALSANKWHHFEYEIKLTASQTIGNVWIDGKLEARLQAAPDAQNLAQTVKYIAICNGVNTSVIKGGEELYFDNLVYEIKTGDISDPDYTLFETGFPADLGSFPASDGTVAVIKDTLRAEDFSTGNITFVQNKGGKADGGYSLKAPVIHTAEAYQERSLVYENASGVSEMQQALKNGKKVTVSFSVLQENPNGINAPIRLKPRASKDGASYSPQNFNAVPINVSEYGKWIKADYVIYKNGDGVLCYDLYKNGGLVDSYTTAWVDMSSFKITAGASYGENVVFYIDDMSISIGSAAVSDALPVCTSDSANITVNEALTAITVPENTTADALAAALKTAENAALRVYTGYACETLSEGTLKTGNVLVAENGNTYNYYNIFCGGDKAFLRKLAVKNNGAAAGSTFTSGSVSAEAVFAVNDSDFDGAVIIAQYDADGTLTRVQAANELSLSGGIKAVSSELSDITADTGAEVKIFALDGGLRPYAPVNSLTAE